MIDIRELRKDPRAYLTKLSRKGADGLVQELLEVDAAWRAATTAAEGLRACQIRRPTCAERRRGRLRRPP